MRISDCNKHPLTTRLLASPRKHSPMDLTQSGPFGLHKQTPISPALMSPRLPIMATRLTSPLGSLDKRNSVIMSSGVVGQVPVSVTVNVTGTRPLSLPSNYNAGSMPNERMNQLSINIPPIGTLLSEDETKNLIMNEEYTKLLMEFLLRMGYQKATSHLVLAVMKRKVNGDTPSQQIESPKCAYSNPSEGIREFSYLINKYVAENGPFEHNEHLNAMETMTEELEMPKLEANDKQSNSGHTIIRPIPIKLSAFPMAPQVEPEKPALQSPPLLYPETSQYSPTQLRKIEFLNMFYKYCPDIFRKNLSAGAIDMNEMLEILPKDFFGIEADTPTTVQPVAAPKVQNLRKREAPIPVAPIEEKRAKYSPFRDVELLESQLQFWSHFTGGLLPKMVDCPV